MYNDYHITAESFGADIPANWEEIADRLNKIIDARNIAEDHDAVNELWESYWNGELDRPKQISLNNGRTYLSAHEAIEALKEQEAETGTPFRKLWDVIAYQMDDDIRETVHMELAPCTEEEFLQRYLELSPDDLIIS